MSEGSTVGTLGFRLLASLSDVLESLGRQSVVYVRTNSSWGEVTLTIGEPPGNTPEPPQQARLTFFEERLYAISASWIDHPRKVYNELVGLLSAKHGRPTSLTIYKAQWMIRDQAAVLLEIVDERQTDLDYIFLPLISAVHQSRDL